MTRTEHLLVILAEECNEVAQRCAKALRFGLREIEPGQRLTNADRIMQEYADLMALVDMLVEDQSLPHGHLTLAIQQKRAKVKRFLNYSEECGTLSAKEPK